MEAALGAYRHEEQPTARAKGYAGVAAVLRATDRGAEVLVIHRAEHPQDPWSGHMALPGGRQDPGDADVRAAAERETTEEVGIDLAAHGRFLGSLDEVLAVSKARATGLVVSPFVYALNRDVEISANEEVQATLWIPLTKLASGEHRTARPVEWEGTRLMLPAWNWQDRIIWGLTWKMLNSLIRLSAP